MGNILGTLGNCRHQILSNIWMALSWWWNNSYLTFSYFINHYTKSTSWEDPRVRYQQIGKPTSSVAKENKFPTSSAATTSASSTSVMASTTTTTSEVHAPPSASQDHAPLQVALDQNLMFRCWTTN